MTLGWELVVWHAIPSMCGKLPVHDRSEYGGLIKEHPILVH